MASAAGGEMPVKIAAVIVNYRTPELAGRSLAALGAARERFPDLRAIVVDGGSADGSADYLARFVVQDDLAGWARFMPLAINGGFGFANNAAIAELTCGGDTPDAILLVNPDARVRPGAIEALAALLEREPRAGAVGGLLIHEDGRAQASAFHYPTLRSEFCGGARTGFIQRLLRVPASDIYTDTAREVPWVTGAAVLLRTAALAEVGLFDDGFFLYFEETELLHRIRRAGWTVWHEPAAKVVHDGGVATQIRDADTGLSSRRRLPRYWYQSTRRYFALTRGRWYALAAGLAFLAGHMVWRLRRLIDRSPDGGPLRSGRDRFAYGLWPDAADARPAVRALGAPAAPRPAWQERRR